MESTAKRSKETTDNFSAELIFDGSCSGSVKAAVQPHLMNEMNQMVPDQ